MTNKPDLEAIEARVAAATEGPWFRNGNPNSPHIDLVCVTVEIPTLTPGKRFGDELVASLENRPEDADFIAHAREDIPQLIKAYREQQECIRELAEVLHVAHEAEPYLCRDIPALLKKWDL